MTARFRPAADLHMRARAAAAYPHEGCGILLGTLVPTDGPGLAAQVTEAIEGRNLVTDRRHDRYELDPGDIVRADQRARGRGEEIVGFYHTHPDHPARPSQFDADHAWAGYLYVVIAVHQGRVVEATAWAFDEAAHRFDPIPMVQEPADSGGDRAPSDRAG